MPRKTSALRAQETTLAQCVYQTLFCFLYSLFLLLMAEQLFTYGIPLAAKLTYGLLFSFILCLMHCYPKADALLRIFITGGLLVYFLSVLSAGRLFDLLFTFNAFALWFIRVFPADVAFNETLFQFFLCLLVTLGVSLALRWKVSPPLFFLMGMVLIIYTYFAQISVSFWLYALFFTVSFTHLTVFVHQKTVAKNGGRQVSPLRYALATLPLCAVALVFASLIPTPAQPPGQAVADRIGAGSLVSDIFVKDYGVDLSYANLTGGLSNGRLGSGRPNQSNAALFTVETDNPAYLSYKHYDTYQSTRWTSTMEDKQALAAYDSLWKGRPLEQNEWIRRQLSLFSRLPRLRTQTIVLHSLRTQSVFISNQTLSVNVNEDLSLEETEGGDVYASVSQGRGFTYTLIDHDEFPDRDELNAMLRRLYQVMDDSQIDLSNDFIKTYTALPGTVPERVVELAQTIAQEQTNPVDIAYALIDYLHENYTYDLDVPRTPSDRDFVDYFLFDMDKGSCTYFASALAVMLRALDIPCRYVEGFMPPPTPSSGNVYTVTGRYAHAWVEIFFPGAGWLLFEPTPPTGLAPDNPALVSPALSPSPFASLSPPPSPSPSSSPDPDAALSPSPSVTPDPDGTKSGFPWWLPLTLMGLCLAFVLARKGRQYQLERFTRHPTPAKMAQLYRRILRRCRRVRLVPQRSETPIEFGLRADAFLQTETPLVSQAAALYAKTLFSGEPPTLDDMRALADIAASFTFAETSFSLTQKRKKRRENESTLDD